MKKFVNICHKKKERQEGSSLIELVLYLGIFSGILFILSQILISTLELQLDTEAASSVEQDGRFILSRISYDIGRADTIATPTNLGDVSNTLSLQIAGDNYTYSLNSQNLILTDSVEGNVLNSFNTDITSLSFKKIGNLGGKPTVQLVFSVSSKINDEILNFQSTLGLR